MPFKMNLRPMMRSMAPMARNNMPQGGLGMAAPRTATGYPIPQNPMMASPGGGGGFDERTGTYTKPRNPIFNALRNINVPMTGGAPNTEPGIFGGMQPRTVTPEEAMAITSMPATQPTPDVYVRPAPRMETPMPEPTMPTTPAFDPNRALNDYNNRLAGIYAGGGNMDMNMVRAQQANLRNLQLDRNATQEQHDAAYRAALSELRSRYPDAFAG